MTALSRRQVLGAAAAAAGLGVMAGPASVVGADHDAKAEFLAFLHPAAADFPVGTVVGFGPDGRLARAKQGYVDGWFTRLRGVRAPGRAVRRHGQLLLPVAVAGVVDVLVSAPAGQAVALGDILSTTQEAGVAAAGGYHRVGTAISTLPARTQGLVRTILSIEVI